MLTHTDAEIARLRAVLRDLVALTTMPATWIGREPAAVAAGLADELIGLLRLDFAFVRLSDPGGEEAVETVRGTGWTAFPGWLERHVATTGRLAGKEIVRSVGTRGEACHGVVIPIGVDAEGGVVAAASTRA